MPVEMVLLNRVRFLPVDKLALCDVKRCLHQTYGNGVLNGTRERNYSELTYASITSATSPTTSAGWGASLGGWGSIGSFDN